MNRNKMPIVGIIAFLLLTMAISLLFGLPNAMAGEATLFVDLTQEQPAQDSLALEDPLQEEGVSQARWVEINWDALKNPQTNQLKIDLFDGETISAVHNRTDLSTSAEGYVWVGHLVGDPYSSVTLSVVGNMLTGSISPGGIERYIILSRDGRQMLQEIDLENRIEVEGPADAIPAPLASAQVDQDTALYCEDGSRIDLLVAYTPGAREYAGGKNAIEALINQRVADMNTANINSGLSFTYRLVHVMETSYPDTGDVLTDLERLRLSNDEFLNDVLQARDQYLADMVSLIIGQSTVNNYCGVGYLMTSLTTSFAPTALNVSALDYVGSAMCSPLTMAHEFGHNMGNQHDRANSTYTNTVLPYSYGYQSPDKTFRTIMAYQCSGTSCPRINQWSNPDISYMGKPTGVDYETNPANSADNVRSMKQTAYYVANFRQNCSTPVTPTPMPELTNHVVLPMILGD
ncbi:MAG: M12 family metallo-peptidase [Candidatus Promineifilaceae bacterium]